MEQLRQTVVDEASLVETFHPRLLYFALRRLRDRSLAEEITQDTLTVTLQALKDNRIEDLDKMPAFIFGVAKNLVLKAIRERPFQGANGSTLETTSETVPWVEDPDAALLLEEKRRDVRQALGQLSSGDQDILRRAFARGQSLEEIACELGIPYVSARKRKSRALERLRKIFTDRSQKR